MTIAVPSNGGLVDEHFGHCKEFLIFRAEGENLITEPAIPSLEGCGCKSGIATKLSKAGVTHLIAGNMGEAAVRALTAYGIQVIRGASGNAASAVRSFVTGQLSDSGLGCTEHGEGSDCKA